MSSIPSVSVHPRRQNTGRSHEILAITILTIAGAIIRLWSLGGLGLVHFDEGIYALAGFWSLSPGGFQSLDPMCIPYSPPGYPLLVGLSYLWFGIRDTSPILVSIMCGTATIPVVGWLSLRTFGRGAGAATAALAAGSAVHVAFSRMALTDSSFLLAFLVAIGQGQRFLERPNPARALLLGLGVGIAQLFKYNGWISGMIVVLTAAIGQIVNRNQQSRKAVVAMWGWGVLAILVAAIVYWPWFQFVEAHGGYRLLLLHQRGYMNGISRWADHWLLQLSQARVLCGNLRWRSSIGIAAALAFSMSASDIRRPRHGWLERIIEALGLAALCVVTNLEWWMPLGWIAFIAICRLSSATPAMLLLGVAWLTLSIMTPFYHPYARLWLPLHGLGWIVMGGIFVAGRGWLEAADRSPAGERKLRFNPLLGFTTICAAALAITLLTIVRARTGSPPSALEPTDSLREACRAITRELPPHVRDLRLFCRPAATFYLSFGNSVNLRPQPNLDRLLEPARPGTWGLFDTALARQERRSVPESSGLTPHWVLARSFPTYLNLPTVLDIDPVSCYEGVFDPSAPLLLLRPGRPEEVR